MENSTNDGTWDDIFNSMAPPIDVQITQSDFDLWDQMILSDIGTLNEAPGSQSLANPNIDSIIATSQNVHAFARNNQEPSPKPDNETFSTSQPVPQIYASLEDLAVIEDIKNQLKELRDTLQEVKRDLVTVKGQYQATQSELYTVKSNHTKLMSWTMDMNEGIKVIGQWIAEKIGATIVGETGLHVEEMGQRPDIGSDVGT